MSCGGGNILTGLAWSGSGLATSNLLMASAPAKSSGTFFAVFAAVTGLAGAVAPLFGGFIAGMLVYGFILLTSILMALDTLGLEAASVLLSSLVEVHTGTTAGGSA